MMNLHRFSSSYFSSRLSSLFFKSKELKYNLKFFKTKIFEINEIKKKLTRVMPFCSIYIYIYLSVYV